MKKTRFSGINKRHMTLIGLVIVIVIAGYANMNYEGDVVPTMATIDDTSQNSTDNNVEDVPKEEEDAYTLAIMERDDKRSRSMSAFREIIDNPNCDKETKENAQIMLSNAAKYINDENTIENTIRAKGVEKNVVYIDDNEVLVLVYDTKLDEIQVAQIKDIVTDKTKINAEKIKIIENN